LNRNQWNQLANDFEDSVCDLTATDLNSQLAKLMKHVKLPSEKARLVDLGCGIGTFIREFGGRFDGIVGIDFAAKILARAKNRQPADLLGRIQWHTMDTAQAPAAIGTCADLTVCLNVVTSPVEKTREEQWAAIAAVTKPGGFALVGIPSIESARMVDEVVHAKKKGPRAVLDPKGLLDRTGAVQKHYSRPELKQIMERHGFTSVRISRVYCPWSEEGMKKPRASAAPYPWDWACLAQRAAAKAAASVAGA
jgi:SAM-dependent methyltransferase